jgi:hypothetical protein
MKKQLLFIALCISSLLSAQSISFTSTITEAQIGTNVTINYQYTIPAAGNIYYAIELFNADAYSSTIVHGQLSPAPAGTAVAGSFVFTIPDATTQTTDLTGNFNYKIKIELSNANWDWQDGDYPDTQINLTNTPLSVNDVDSILEQFSIYPNPAKNSIQIINFSRLKNPSIKIFNLLGKEVLSTLNSSEIVEVSSLVNGIYILSIKTEKITKSIKFVKI